MVVEFLRLRFPGDADQVGGIRQIAVMENEISLVDVWVLINVIDTPRVEKLELRRLMP